MKELCSTNASVLCKMERICLFQHSFVLFSCCFIFLNPWQSLHLLLQPTASIHELCINFLQVKEINYHILLYPFAKVWSSTNQWGFINTFWEDSACFGDCWRVAVGAFNLTFLILQPSERSSLGLVWTADNCNATGHRVNHVKEELTESSEENCLRMWLKRRGILRLQKIIRP